MIQYESQFQLKIAEFQLQSKLKLNPTNRWTVLANLLPWDKLVSIYGQKFSWDEGRKAINPRIVIGAFIIKHKLNISDEECVEIIRENPYMQFFLGLDTFHDAPLFSPTCFVEWRKQLGQETFDQFNIIIIKMAQEMGQILEDKPSKSKKTTNQAAEEPTQSERPAQESTATQPKNRGKLKIDATVAPQYIKYPNDLDLINEARLKTEQIIDQLYVLVEDKLPVKPRTYRRLANERYLKEAKKKKKQKNVLRKTLRYLLNCVERNLTHINLMLDMLGQAFPLSEATQRQLWIIHTLYAQQKEMYDLKTNRCNDRIVSLSQPHVRPIVRGKQGKSVEFGAKLNLSLLENGFLYQNTLKWDNFNEGTELIKQAEEYKAIFGFYPELIQADKIYATNQNRTFCKENNIRITAIPKGKAPEQTAKQKAKTKKEFSERNAIEGRIGNAKQAFSLDQIKAKLKRTSGTWVAAIFFVMNLSKLTQGLF